MTYKWFAIPQETRDGVKGFVTDKIMSLCSDEELYRTNHLLLGKLNLALVEVWLLFPFFVFPVPSCSLARAVLLLPPSLVSVCASLFARPVLRVVSSRKGALADPQERVDQPMELLHP